MAGSGTAHLRERDDVLVRVEHMVVEFPLGRGEKVHAVSDVSFDLVEGETLGIVGESGCGKSTTGRAILQLPRRTSGSIRLKGEDLVALDTKTMRAKRTDRMEGLTYAPKRTLILFETAGQGNGPRLRPYTYPSAGPDRRARRLSILEPSGFCRDQILAHREI